MTLRTLRSFFRLPSSGRRMALEAAFLLALARALVLFVPMRHWRDRLDTRGQTGADVAAGGGAGTGAVATSRTVGRMVERVARRLPFDATCLAQAMASQWMLRRRHVASKLCLGVRRRVDGTVALHAWLTVDGTCVVGGRRSGTFAPLSAPADAGRRRSPASPAR